MRLGAARQPGSPAARQPGSHARLLRDGFDVVEISIKENALADEQFAAGNTATHAQVMRDALRAIQAAKHKTQAAA